MRFAFIVKNSTNKNSEYLTQIDFNSNKDMASKPKLYVYMHIVYPFYSLDINFNQTSLPAVHVKS